MPSQKSGRSCICVLGVTYMCVRGIGLASVSTICRLDFELCPDKVSILFFLFYEIEICTVNAVQVSHKHE